MMIIVHITSKSGIFTWLANEILKKTKGRPIAILTSLAIFTAVASAFLDNVTTVILVMPITFAVCKLLDINPVPFLVTDIFCSNIGGTATLIGDPPNIIIGSAANFSFMDFVRELTLVVLIIMFVIITLMIFIYRKDLKTTAEKMAAVCKIDNSKTIKDKPLAIRSGIVLLLVIFCFDLIFLQRKWIFHYGWRQSIAVYPCDPAAALRSLFCRGGNSLCLRLPQQDQNRRRPGRFPGRDGAVRIGSL